MTVQSTKSPCKQPAPAPGLPPSFIAPESSPRGAVRPSRSAKKRAWALIALHLAIFAHLVHWRMRGTTASPLEPSEAMYTLRDGIVNCGAVLLVLSVLSTLVLGRFFCGWGCHVVALQDLCAWLLKKVGIHPRPLRSRWLVLVPLLAGLYMFFWPSLMGMLNGIPPPSMKNGLLKVEFWETFPGFWIGALTFLVCGFVIVYLLGSKGFCTYACPYGGLFGVADRLAAGRIRVTDACKQCGHCTAVCTSNVVVNREVLEYGMVVDPGCMKCRDCISVCPENALYFGFGKPALFAKARRKLAKVAPQFSWREELAMLATFGITLAIFRGIPEVQTGNRIWFQWSEELYGKIPLLFALGMAAITAFMVVIAWRVLRRPVASFVGLGMKTDGRLTRAGKVFLASVGVWILFLAHSAAVQAQVWRGLALVERDEPTKQIVWWQNKDALAQVPAQTRERWRAGDERLATADRIGLVRDYRIPRERAWIAMADQRLSDASALLGEAVRRNRESTGLLRDSAHVDMLRGESDRALASLREAVAIHPHDLQAHRLIVAAHLQKDDLSSAIAAQRTVVSLDRTPQARIQLADMVARTGDPEATIVELRALVAELPDLAPAQGMLGLTLQHAGRPAEATPHLEKAEKLSPGIVQRLLNPDSQPTTPR